MPSRGLRGLWLRSFTAVAACLVALASTGALVAAAVVAPTPTPSLSSSPVKSTDGKDITIAPLPKLATPKPVAIKPIPAPKPPTVAPTPRPVDHPAPAPKVAAPPASVHAVHPAHPAAPAPAVPTARVVVDSSDPAPFSAEAVAATEAARVLPVESLGPLSGISFGSGLFVWPLLLAVDVLALAVIARMALRRRIASPED